MLLIVISHCTTIEYLNDFSMRGLHSSSFLPRPADSIPVPHARISGSVQYSNSNNLHYNDGKHAPVDSNGAFHFESITEYECYGNCGYVERVIIDSACTLSYKGSNIHWRTPPLFTSFSADFGPFARVISVCTQTDYAFMDNEFFINFKMGPSVQFSPGNTGIRADFIFSIGNYYYSYETVKRYASNYVDWYLDRHVNNAGTIFGFCPYITVNTLREYLRLCYYFQAGYQLQLPFYYEDSYSVKLSYALFNLGIFKNISNYQILAGARFAFETKHNYYDDPHPNLRKRNKAGTPFFPTFFVNASYNINFHKRK
ncbi:MAG: hypothetical protein GX556_09325 [Fibrobacter sp.]|nr:hypothetical protein [Fibrobacter sp.]